jgi:hypothetical protein
MAAVMVFCCLIVTAGSAEAVQSVDSRVAKLDKIIDRIQRVILRAQTLHAEGELKPGHPFTAAITPGVRLTFHAERFDADLETALGLHDKLVRHRHKMAGPAGRKQVKVAPAAKKKRRPAAAVPEDPPDDPIAAMRQAEKLTSAASPRPPIPAPANYDVYMEYRKTHAESQLQRDRAAEADMAVVLAQRKQAETERVQKRQRQQELQAQATKWQAELDKQASQSAQAAAQWEKEHSFGAYAARFLGIVAQTAVGSFTTALLSPVAVNLANKTVGALFPSVDTTNLAAQAATASATRVAVTNLGSAAGQAAANSVTGPPAGSNAAQGLQQPAY